MAVRSCSAVHEQFNVFDTLTRPYEQIQLTDLQRVVEKVATTRILHFKMNQTTTKSAKEISAEVVKNPDGDKIKLSFIVIVTNIEINGGLSKMPVFVVMCSGKRRFIDMNLTVFHSWEAFLKNNDFPPCQYCFPLGGRYCVGERLKIDFASSPAAIREMSRVKLIWRACGFVVGVGLVVSSFFFTIPPIKHSQADSLLSIAEGYVPQIRKYGMLILRGVTIIQKLRSGDNKDKIEGLVELWKFLTWINNEFSEEISYVLKAVRNALWKLYDWIRKKLSHLFGNASDLEQQMFVAVTSRVDHEINIVESEAEEILEASRKNNRQSQTTVVAAAIHDQVGSGVDTRYAKNIFRNAKNESALQNGVQKIGNVNPHPITSNLLDISTSLAEKLGKSTLKDHQDIFEALCSIVKDEYKNKIKIYSKILEAAKAGAGHGIDLKAFNQSLGIEGDPKEYYWQEAMISVMEPRLAYRTKEKVQELEKQKKILVLPLSKQDEDDLPGIYRLVGVNGVNKFTANELIKALKEMQFDLREEELVTNETSSMIMIRTEELTLAAVQEVNSENTSEGMLLVVKTAV